ncbi:LacI family DNA-binding transcriptional regulator [Haloferula rosea]|uniref:LacI family DNA-binding transcriptional regulator n=1 Tax=Haloferula rosea TaxID=490093 RepID=A0A934RFY6_9BACT|nr:LacI family DNA-binding transcriptional regulator [Haloferula rosea]MBK1827655.1 LacI family DNA-binding transcriptional regulator [Haloferula rosea]
MSKSGPSGKHVTLRDIGAALGVSHSTVSLALRDHPRISEKMRAKVKSKAEELGYQPDPMLAALATYRRSRTDQPITASIAWINAWPDPKDLRAHREFDSYWQGASKAAEKFGYRLEEFRLDANFTPERLHQILDTRGIRGLLLPPHHNQPDWKNFPWDKYSVVRFGRTLQSPSCHIVTADQVANTILAFQKMHERGYRRIGFVAHNFEFRYNGMLFELGYIGGQRMIDDCVKLPPLLLRRRKPDEVRASLRAWLDEHRPDAIFTTLTDLPAMLKREQLTVPDDIAVAATTILDTNVDSGIDQHPEEIGRVGFLMLNSLINDGSRGIPDIFRQILVEGSWVDGSSLPDRSA